MRLALICIIGAIFLSIPVLAIEININKDTPNTELIVTNKGFGYKTVIQTDENSTILNIPSNVEVITTSSAPIKIEEKTKSFFIFTLYQGQTYYFENVNNLEVVFRYPEGYGQFSTNLYDSLRSLYS